MKSRYESSLSDAQRLTVLNAFLSMRYRDTDIMERTAKLIVNNTITQANSITNFLYILAKFGFKPNENNPSLMAKCASILVAEPVLPVKMVSRNLWNFSQLGHFDRPLFDKCSTIIAKNTDQITHIDVANILKAFA